MDKRLLSFAIPVMIVGTLSARAGAATITIGASKDATIFENNLNNSNGAGPGIFAGTNGMNSPRRGLIDFDIAGNVPAGATLTNVQLTLHLGQVAGTDQTPRTISLFRLTDDWGEGTTGSGGTIGGAGQGFPANSGDATWNARFFPGTSFPGTSWTTPGGDHVTTASASSTVGTVINDPYTWASTASLINDVQGWLDTPASNFGWELINLDEATPTDFRAFYTRDFSDPTLRPELQVTFTPQATAPEPGSTALVSIGALVLALAAIQKPVRKPALQAGGPLHVLEARCRHKLVCVFSTIDYSPHDKIAPPISSNILRCTAHDCRGSSRRRSRYQPAARSPISV